MEGFSLYDLIISQTLVIKLRIIVEYEVISPWLNAAVLHVLQREIMNTNGAVQREIGECQEFMVIMIKPPRESKLRTGQLETCLQFLPTTTQIPAIHHQISHTQSARLAIFLHMMIYEFFLSKMDSYCNSFVTKYRHRADRPCIKSALPDFKVENYFDKRFSQFSYLHDFSYTCKKRFDSHWCYVNTCNYFPPEDLIRGLTPDQLSHVLNLHGADFTNEINSLRDDQKHVLLRKGQHRLRTFDVGWPHEPYLPVLEMVNEGFYLLNNGDMVQCIFCLGILGKFQEGDSISSRHLAAYPDCPFVRGEAGENVPLPVLDVVSTDNNKLIRLSNDIHGLLPHTRIENFGIIPHINAVRMWPEHRNLHDISYRTFTLSQLPHDYPVKNKHLADAGFYFERPPDILHCFTCHLTTSNWKPGDDPWVEHARANPNCQYVLAIKSPKFVETVRAQKGLSPSLEPRPGYLQIHGQLYKKGFEEDEDLQAMVTWCKSLGYKQMEIEEVLRRNQGSPLTTTEAIIQAVQALRKESLFHQGAGPQAYRSYQLTSDETGIKCRACNQDNKAEYLCMPCGCWALCNLCAQQGVPTNCCACQMKVNAIMKTYSG